MDSKGDEAFHLQPKRTKLTSIPVNIPEELITEILLRLPVKSLLQFRSVSKSWLDLICSPQFVKTHLGVCANNKDYTHHKLILELDSNVKSCSLSSFLCDSVIETFELNCPRKNNTSRFAFVVGSVNGLICLNIQRNLFLWNPSIRKLRKLCDTIDGYLPVDILLYGFGYDELHDDYKVVVVCRYWGNDNDGFDQYKAKMYSLNRDSWISVDDCFQPEPVINKPMGMFVNGKLHWATTSRDVRSYNGWDISSIDLADGKWGKVEKPCYGEGDFDFTLCLGMLGSDLSLFCTSWRSYMDVWVMKEYGIKESWTKVLTINRTDDMALYTYSPFFCKSNADEIMFGFKSSVIIYNKKVDSITYQELINCGTFNELNICIESLLWPFFAGKGTRDTTTPKAHLKTIACK